METLTDIVEAARALRAENPECPLLLATVVNVGGASSLRVGGHLLIAEDRWIDDRWIAGRMSDGLGPASLARGGLSGSIGIGSTEEEIIRQAWWFTRDGVPALLRHTATGEESAWRLGRGESSLVDLLVVPCDVDDPYDPVAFFESCLRAQKPGAVATVLRSVDGRPGLGSRLQIGPDGVLRSQVGDARLAEAFAGRTRQVLASGRSEIYAHGGMEALIEAVVSPQSDRAIGDLAVADIGRGGLHETRVDMGLEPIKTAG
jgi:hypothetical protein